MSASFDMRRVERAAEWEEALEALPDPHLLQSWDWGDFKSRHGWEAERRVWRDREGRPRAAAQLLRRTIRLPGRPSILYCPRGPVLDWSDAATRDRVLHDLAAHARASGAIFLKIDPDQPVAALTPGAQSPVADSTGEAAAAALSRAGWKPSPEQIQFRNTLILDLRDPEEVLLARMKQKTRYNIRLAERHGVKVRPASAEELTTLYRMFAETSVRDGFVIRGPDYYQEVWGDFQRAGMAQSFLAEIEGQPAAALIIYRHRARAWYLYGMSRAVHREAMPNHLLQWEAIRWARAQGCTSYDFWGAPDQLDPQDPLWGVYRFKEGFGGRMVYTLGAWDLSFRPVAHRLYAVVLPRLLSLLRRRGVRQTQQALD